jgi:hypothetical protein
MDRAVDYRVDDAADLAVQRHCLDAQATSGQVPLADSRDSVGPLMAREWTEPAVGSEVEAQADVGGARLTWEQPAIPGETVPWRAVRLELQLIDPYGAENTPNRSYCSSPVEKARHDGTEALLVDRHSRS